MLQVVGCAALNVCDLRNNLLESVPCELGSLVTMRNLRLEGNANMAAQVVAIEECRSRKRRRKRAIEERESEYVMRQLREHQG